LDTLIATKTKTKYNIGTSVEGSHTTSLENKNISIMYTNADSLANKLQELKLLLNNTSPRPKIIALTEVKHKNKINGAWN